MFDKKCIFLTSDVETNYTRTFAANFTNQSTTEFLEGIPKINLFKGMNNLEAIIYRDKDVSIPLIESEKPLHMFPNVAYPIDVDVSSRWQYYGFISIVPNSNELSRNIQLIATHKRNFLPKLKFLIPIDKTSGKNILDIMKNNNKTFNDCFESASNQIYQPEDSVILKVSNGKTERIIKPQDKLSEIYSLLFSEDGIYNPKCVFTYDIMPKTYNNDDSRLVQIYNVLTACDPTNTFLHNFIKELLRAIQDGVGIGNITKTSDYAASQYFLPYIRFVSNDATIEISSWEELSVHASIVKSDGLTTVSNRLLFAIIKWPEFITVAVNITKSFIEFFYSKRGTAQSFQIFGPIVFASKNLPSSCSLLMTKGFIHFANFEPRISSTYDILPDQYLFNTNSISVLPILSSVPIEDVEFVPDDTRGIFISDTVQCIELGSKDLGLQFMICHAVAKAHLELRRLYPTIGKHGDLVMELSAPIPGEVFGKVQMLGHHWTVRVPFSKIIKSCMKLQSLAFIPTLELCGAPLKHALPAPELPELQTRAKTSQWSFVKACLNDLLFCSNTVMACSVIAPFKVSDFPLAIANRSLSLIKTQIEMFREAVHTFHVGGVPIIHYAALVSPDPAIIRELLKVFAVDSTDDCENTPLMYSLRNPSMEIMKTLVVSGANIDFANRSGETPLIAAIEMRAYDRAEYLLKMGASPNCTLRTNTESALMQAITINNMTAIELMVPYLGASVNNPTSRGEFVVHKALQSVGMTGFLKGLPLLDGNLSTPLFPHPLHFLLVMPYDENKLNDVLAIPGIDVNRLDDNGDTPLLAATRKKNHAYVARIVKDERCDLDFVDAYGRSALFIAAENGSADDVKAIVVAGAIVDMPDNSGATPLYVSLNRGDATMSTFLINAGACQDLWYHNGKLPIHIGNKNALPPMFSG